ncbi:hypothetical protein KGP36_02530 [Patescibacteria group bacterium]|nr:hypothetical protein [Patescibacteria group bacterium]
MALDENDLSRITDRLKIVVHEMMQEHMDKVHAVQEAASQKLIEDLENKFSEMEKMVGFWKGAMWAFGGVFTIVLALLELAKR